MRSLWVTDAWETLDHPLDTTLRLIEASLTLGQTASWCDPAGLRFQSGHVIARCQRVLAAPPGRGATGWLFEALEDVKLSEFDAVHYRTDPPVDRRYWEHLHLLAIGSRDGPEIVNPISALTHCGDKIGPTALAHTLPPMVVSSSWESLRAFGHQEGKTVLKPLGGAQSKGVRLLDWQTPSGEDEARALIEHLSERFARPIVLQAYLPQIHEGEKRLWFADGELLAFVRKRPLADSFLIDMDKGSTCEACDLTAAEKHLALSIGATLHSEGIRLAAVDLIGGYVTDWNLTSPGMLPTMERVLDRDLARPVMHALARGHTTRSTAKHLLDGMRPSAIAT